jgi:hypothetical protein
MKKLAVLVCALIPALSAFATNNGHGILCYADETPGFIIFLMIVYIILSIVVLVRWWKMTTNVEDIRQKIIPNKPDLAYLIAIGEKEQAQKAALTNIVDMLYNIYIASYATSKAVAMNRFLESNLPQMVKLGLTLPDYVTSGEKFIDYMNELTGNKVPYEGLASTQIVK